ncbi:hypothetical protein FACS1894196_2740 [Clostridia bacterium]|nr:hypothetical protein FACS1894196_2740 [Clostridia bacterium]
MHVATLVRNSNHALRDACKSQFIRLPQSELPVSAGTGMPLPDTEEIDYLYVRMSREACRADEIIPVNGDSMEPTYKDGDLLLVEHTDSLEAGEVGVFVVAGEGFVKEYREDGLYSHNAEYDVIRPTEDDNAHCIGRVLGVVKDGQLASPKEQVILGEIYAGEEKRGVARAV